MTQKTYIVEGRQFRTTADYNRAVRDKEIIDKLRKESNGYSRKQLERLKADVHGGKYRFLTMLGRDFEDELEERIRKTSDTKSGKSQASKKNAKHSRLKGLSEAEMNAIVQEELKKQEKHRRMFIVLCSLLAIGCLGYFGIYSYYNYRTNSTYEQLNELKEKPFVQRKEAEPVIHYTTDEPAEPREVLDEYKNLLNKNKKLIGWVKIDYKNIHYPLMHNSYN